MLDFEQHRPLLRRPSQSYGATALGTPVDDRLTLGSPSVVPDIDVLSLTRPSVNDNPQHSDDDLPLLEHLPRQPQPSRWQRFKNWVSSLFTRDEATSFVTANTPGLYTGVIGGGGVATGIAGGDALAKHVNATALNRATPAFSLGTMGADVLGLYGAINEARTGHSQANAPNAHRVSRYEGRSRRKRGILDALTRGTDLLTAQGGSAASGILKAAEVGGAAVTPLAAVGGIGGSVVSSAVAARSGWRGGRALMHAYRGRQVQNRIVPGTSGPVGSAVAYHQAQMGKRAGRHILGATGATASAVGGALATAALIGGAAALGPIGWGLLAAGGLVALGIGAHKLYRWYQKRKAGTLHTEREGHAAAIVDALHGPSGPDKKTARDLLRTSFGEDYLNRVQRTRDPQHRQALIDSVARKLQGW
ncbi:MAG TPA: hypothetical protein VK669_07600 [Candidatus Limnocylindrales bacterium]|nr:hypothetical protein [Candidatus Limnocylindrales bacterium]